MQLAFPFSFKRADYLAKGIALAEANYLAEGMSTLNPIDIEKAFLRMLISHQLEKLHNDI